VIANDIDKIKEQLVALRIPVYLAPAARTLDDSYAQINDLGRLTGHVAEATATVRHMQADIDRLVKDVKPRKRKLTYFHELDPTLYTATSKTFLGSVYAMFGLVNVADPADTTGGGYPQMSAEALIKASPDLYFLADTKCCQESWQTVEKRPGFTRIAGVRNGRVVSLDDDIASRWGPRVVDFARVVADAVAKVPAE
jgi:iron complex transport system substrate-binding protein